MKNPIKFICIAVCAAVLLCCAACGGSGTNETTGESSVKQTAPVVTTTEPVINNMSNFSFVMKHTSISGDETTEKALTLVFCEAGWYWNGGNNESSLFINDGNRLYSLDNENKTKELKVEGDAAKTYAEGKSVFTEYYAMLTSHNEYDPQTLEEAGTETIAGRECKILKLSPALLPDGSSITYWIDTQTGIAMKCATIMSAAGSAAETTWELTEFTVGGQAIDEYTAYTDAAAE